MTEQPPPPDPQQPSSGQAPPPPPVQPGQAPYGQPQYGQPQYGQPQYGQPAYFAPPNHNSATTALVLGILGLLFCPLVLSIPAMLIGKKAVREIDASQGQLGGRSNANAGYILGIIGTVWGAIATLIVVAVFVLGGVITDTFENTCSTVDDGSGITTTC